MVLNILLIEAVTLTTQLTCHLLARLGSLVGDDLGLEYFFLSYFHASLPFVCHVDRCVVGIRGDPARVHRVHRVVHCHLHRLQLRLLVVVDGLLVTTSV